MASKRKPNQEMQEAVVEYLGGKCMYCGSTKAQVHHILPISRGGKNSLSNYELACRSCHNQLHIQINKIMPLKRVFTRKCVRCGASEERKILFKDDGGMCKDCRYNTYKKNEIKNRMVGK